MGGDELREKGPTVSQFTKIPKFYIFAAITLLYTLYTVSQKMSQPWQAVVSSSMDRF